MLNEHYCDFFQITDLDDPTRPWASVADNDVEGLRELWGISRRRAEFKIYEIHSNYGYNFTEFINLPRWFVEDILQDRRDEERKLRVARENAANKIKQGQKTDGLPSDDLRGFKP